VPPRHRYGSEQYAHSPAPVLNGLACKIAGQKGISVAQTAIARALSRGEDIVPLIGTRTRERLAEALGALDVVLDEADLTAIEQAVPARAATGERYPSAQMAQLDSER
jgi:aryl-alcohol dehydrogenase-like predicted oxidoreductase